PGRLTVELHRIGDCVWEIPRQGGMRVPGRIYASEKLMRELRDDPALGQVANVAHLPGIVGHALAMPDIHWGYGFPIGGVAAVDAEEGVISPGGIGFDINCGVRLVRTGLEADALAPRLTALADALYQAIPAGVGSEGAIPKLTQAEEKQMLVRGSAWGVARGFGPRDGAPRHPGPRPAARLRAARLARGAAVPRRHGGGGELRLDEPPGHARARRAGLRPGARPRTRRSPLRPRLRRLSQHREVRGARRRGPPPPRLRPPQGRDPCLRSGPPGPRPPPPPTRAAGHH